MENKDQTINQSDNKQTSKNGTNISSMDFITVPTKVESKADVGGVLWKLSFCLTQIYSIYFQLKREMVVQPKYMKYIHKYWHS